MKHTIFAFLVALLIALLIFVLRRRQYNNLISLIMESDYDGFNQKCDSLLSKIVLTRYSRDFLKLNVAYILNDHEAIEKHLANFERMYLSQKAKSIIYSRAFSYYVALEHKERAHYYRDLINKQVKNPKVISEVNRVCDTYIDNGYQYLDEVLAETEKMPEMYRGANEYIIAHMYKNKGDEKMAKEYADLSKSHIAQLDRHLKEKRASKTNN